MKHFIVITAGETPVRCTSCICNAATVMNTSVDATKSPSVSHVPEQQRGTAVRMWQHITAASARELRADSSPFSLATIHGSRLTTHSHVIIDDILSLIAAPRRGREKTWRVETGWQSKPPAGEYLGAKWVDGWVLA